MFPALFALRNLPCSAGFQASLLGYSSPMSCSCRARLPRRAVLSVTRRGLTIISYDCNLNSLERRVQYTLSFQGDLEWSPFFYSRQLSGSGDFCKYAATPITALINAAATPILTVAPIPACKLKCPGSIPTAAKPVITPPAAPLTPAASIPFNHTSTRLAPITAPLTQLR